jgi:hypothetical protein
VCHAMSKPKRSEVEELLMKRAKAAAEIRNIKAALDADAAPLKEAFEKKFGPLQDAAAAKAAPFQETVDALDREIETRLMAGVELNNGLISLPQVLVEHKKVSTLAEVLKVPGPREIDVLKFFDFVPPSQRGRVFYECLKVQMGKTDKLLGKEAADKLAKTPFKYEVKIGEVDS